MGERCVRPRYFYRLYAFRSARRHIPAAAAFLLRQLSLDSRPTRFLLINELCVYIQDGDEIPLGCRECYDIEAHSLFDALKYIFLTITCLLSTNRDSMISIAFARICRVAIKWYYNGTLRSLSGTKKDSICL